LFLCFGTSQHYTYLYYQAVSKVMSLLHSITDYRLQMVIIVRVRGLITYKFQLQAYDYDYDYDLPLPLPTVSRYSHPTPTPNSTPCGTWHQHQHEAPRLEKEKGGKNYFYFYFYPIKLRGFANQWRDDLLVAGGVCVEKCCIPKTCLFCFCFCVFLITLQRISYI
jgi:hypothetical protein